MKKNICIAILMMVFVFAASILPQSVIADLLLSRSVSDAEVQATQALQASFVMTLEASAPSSAYMPSENFGYAPNTTWSLVLTPSIIMLIATFSVPLVVIGAFLIVEKRKVRANRRAKAIVRQELASASFTTDMYKFAGKFDVYLSQTDELPAAYALVKIGSDREISVREILKKCSHFKGISDLPDPEYVYFTLNSKGIFKITNDSDCAVFIRSDRLKVSKRRVLSQGDNVHIKLADDRELVISPRFLFQID